MEKHKKFPLRQTFPPSCRKLSDAGVSFCQRHRRCSLSSPAELSVFGLVLFCESDAQRHRAGCRCYGNAAAAEGLQTEKDLWGGESHTCIHPHPKHTHIFFSCATHLVSLFLSFIFNMHIFCSLSLSLSCTLSFHHPALYYSFITSSLLHCIYIYPHLITSPLPSLSPRSLGHTARRGQGRSINQSLRT